MSALDNAWQSALAAEHEAVFGYGVLGPHLPADDQLLARASQRAHETLREATEDALTDAHLTPVAPLADYPAEYPMPDAASARRHAVELEDRCATAWRFLYLLAASASGARTPRMCADAQTALIGSAVRASRWRALSTPNDPTVAFPGA